ncbi:hypothetical protein [Allokutzneria sp. NRRL B-24872]|uniref:hypothetical protein n=1 Tax=Allokutzneria sp. NRRL B-24872 TaxID=1137961 RepID=UPI000A3D5CDA|nr:hypothetical protein [Allokutzneria sp. NRRL B-24872]
MSTPRAAGIEPETILWKAVHPALAQLYLGNVAVPGKFEPHRAAGAVVLDEDFPQTLGVAEIEGWPTGTQYALRFLAHSTVIFDGHVMELTELAAGTELWRIEPDGGQERVGGYVNRQVGWIPTGDVGFGPGRFWSAPVALRTTVRRGLLGRYRDQDFDVDFASTPGSVLLHPLTGEAVPSDFTERTLEVPAAAVSDLGFARKLCTYRDAEFEIVGVIGDHAVLHFVGEDHDAARQLGLSEVDFRQWRAFVHRNELHDIRDEFRPLS